MKNINTLLYSFLLVLLALPMTSTQEESPKENLKEEIEKKRIERTTFENMKEQSIRPLTATDDREDLVEIHFEDADLKNILEWVSRVFKVSFLTDDVLNPVGKFPVANKKITFKTHEPLTKKQAWDLFVTFLDLWGLALDLSSVPNIYQVQPTKPDEPATITKAPLPSYINTKWTELPDNDMFIRYVYFVKNSTLATIQNIVNTLKSNVSRVQPFKDLDAIIITDKSSNIRSLMKIIEALDKQSMPEQMSVLRLKNTNAEDVAKLYDSLTKGEDSKSIAARIFGSKKVPTKTYFPETTQIIPEPRTNSLIILGDYESIQKIEDFIINHVDTEIKAPYSPLYVYALQYADANDIVKILEQVTKFGQQSADPSLKNAAYYGGVREGDKFFQPMSFQAEPSGNRVIIRAEKEDYLKVRDIIKQLDVPQPQVAIEVLVVQVTSSDDRQLGVQIRNKNADSSIDAQNSGFPLAGGAQSPPVVNSTTGSIATNLIGLARAQDPGSLLISIGNAATSGVWAIFKILQANVHTKIISNPFLVATNKYSSIISVGETRRVITSQVFAGENNQSGFEDKDANLTVKVTPQINTDGIINLVISFELTTFQFPVTAANQGQANQADRISNIINTNANVANGEVLAFGGLLKQNLQDTVTKIPILGDIPLLGWLFKNKIKSKRKSNILVFVSPHVIAPQKQGGIDYYSEEKVNAARDLACSDAHSFPEQRDPIHRWFFKDNVCPEDCIINDFAFSKNDQSKFIAPEQRNAAVDTEHLVPQNNVFEATEQMSVPVVTKNSLHVRKKEKTSLVHCMPSNNKSEGAST